MTNSNEWTKVEMGDTWDFETNPELVGIFSGKEEGVGANESMLYSIETDSGIVSVWGSNILDTRLKNVKEGEEVKIVYLGKEKSLKTGRTYKSFDVYHRMPVDTAEVAEGEKLNEVVNPEDLPFE